MIKVLEHGGDPGGHAACYNDRVPGFFFLLEIRISGFLGFFISVVCGSNMWTSDQAPTQPPVKWSVHSCPSSHN